MNQSYLDEKYLVHYFESLARSSGSYSEEEDARREMLKYFKSKTDIILDSDFPTILNQLDPLLKPVLSRILTDLTTGRNGTRITSNQHNLFRNLKNVNIYSKLKYPFVSFWLGKSYKHPVDKYRKVNPYFFITDKDDIDIWKSYSKAHTYYIGTNANKNSKDILSDWKQLNDFAHPFKDIIISDGFCLNDNIGIRNNIIQIVENLSSDLKQIENIIFFVKPDKLWKNSVQETFSLLKELFNDKDISANLIIYASNKTPHDRYIVTNNFLLKSGDSFDYFNPNGEYKTRGTSLSITPIFNANNSELDLLLQIFNDISSNAEGNLICGKQNKSILDLLR